MAPFPVQYRAYELTHLSGVAQVTMFLTGSRIGKRPAAAEIAGLAARSRRCGQLAVFGAGLAEAGLPGGVIGLDARSPRPATAAGWPRTWRPSVRSRTTA